MPDRIEREIEEVLGQIEDFEWHRQRRRGRSRLRTAFDGAWGRTAAIIDRVLLRVTPGNLMLVGFLLLLTGAMVRGRGPGAWLVLAGILVFAVALLWSMRSNGAARPAARGAWWRDRYITYAPARGRGGWRRWFRRDR